MCVIILLFQAIKYVPIYSKAVRELCLRKPGRKRKEPKIVHVIGQLADNMLGNIFTAKYSDPGSSIVNVQINDVLIPNTLIDLGDEINVMTRETMDMLGLSDLRDTPIVLQLAGRSTIKLEGIIEDLVISIDSWEYPADFMVLWTKSKLGGHPFLLGRPWLATSNAYIGCRSGNMNDHLPW